MPEKRRGFPQLPTVSSIKVHDELQQVQTDLTVLHMEHLDHMVAGKVRRAMSDAGLGLGDLAARSGLPASDLRSLLAAHGSFTVDELVRIAAAVDCRILDLLPDEGDAG